MYFARAVLLLLASTVTAAPFASPASQASTSTTAATVIQDITILDNNVKALITSLNSFGFLTAPPSFAAITAVFAAVHASNRQAYSDALNIKSAYSVKDSNSILSVVESTLDIDNPKAVAVVKAKKSLFDTFFVSGLILNSLQTLLADHLSLSAALQKWVDPSLKTEADYAVKIITFALEDAISYYSS